MSIILIRSFLSATFSVNLTSVFDAEPGAASSLKLPSFSFALPLDNTPAFDYETNKFKDEVLASYNKMVSNPENDGFFTVELISKYLDVIAQNNDVINENVRKYIRDSYLQVENEYGILNPYTGI